MCCLGGSGPSGGVKVDELSDEELQAAVDEAKTQVRRMQLETQMFQGMCSNHGILSVKVFHGSNKSGLVWSDILTHFFGHALRLLREDGPWGRLLAGRRSWGSGLPSWLQKGLHFHDHRLAVGAGQRVPNHLPNGDEPGLWSLQLNFLCFLFESA